MDRLMTMEAFIRVVEAGSFTDAAKSWGCSRGAMSKYVSWLEAHLGVGLLHRTTRSLRLTEAGHRYYESCLGLLGEIEALESSLREDQVSPRGALRVTAPPGLMSRFQGALTTDFVARYPGISMELLLTHRMVDLVEQGVDVAIRVTEPKDSSLIARRLAPAPLRLVASPGYLRRHGRPSKPEDLRRHACLVDTNFREAGRWKFEIDGEVEVVEVSGPFRANSPLTIRDLALQDQGIALVIDFVVAEDLAEGRLLSLMEGCVGIHWSVYAVYPRRRYLPGRVRVFIEHLAEVLGPSGA